jgi:hypothetical protein
MDHAHEAEADDADVDHVKAFFAANHANKRESGRRIQGDSGNELFRV